MEIRIADNWKWITIDTDGTRWIWEKEPEYLEDNMSWEIGQEAGRSSGVGGSALEITFGDDIQHAKDKIWKRNGEDWEYAGGHVTGKVAIRSLTPNLTYIFDFIGLSLGSHSRQLLPSGAKLEFIAHSDVDKPADFAIKAHKLAQLIKDAEGGKDEN